MGLLVSLDNSSFKVREHSDDGVLIPAVCHCSRLVVFPDGAEGVDFVGISRSDHKCVSRCVDCYFWKGLFDVFDFDLFGAFKCHTFTSCILGIDESANDGSVLSRVSGEIFGVLEILSHGSSFKISPCCSIDLGRIVENDVNVWSFFIFIVVGSGLCLSEIGINGVKSCLSGINGLLGCSLARVMAVICRTCAHIHIEVDIDVNTVSSSAFVISFFSAIGIFALTGFVS